MSEPTELLIVQNLQAALQGISVAAGYHYDVASLAVKLDPNQRVEDLLGETAARPFYVLELTPDEWEYSPSKMVLVRMPATIHAVHVADTTDDAAWLQTYLRLCADVEQAIAVDISRGGRAIDTRITSRDFHSFGGGEVWARVQTTTSVRRNYGVPNG
jgi:hypothetical protein